MRNFYPNCLKVFLTGLVLFLLAGCAGKSFDYHPVHEIPKGPGLFSDEEDGKVVYDSKKSKVEESSRESQRATDQQSAVKSDKSGVDEEKAPDYKEFQEYQEWKEWQKSKKDSDEFKEFQEWREWKSYQEWKKKSGLSTE
jgi:hypothetical protein